MAREQRRRTPRPTPRGPRALVALVVLTWAPAAGAADHYVRAGAKGANDGTSWTDAWTDFPSPLARGDTYYVATGDYPAQGFDTREQGTDVITIRRATVAQHGAGAGWDDAYASGPATFGKIYISTSYWTFDGAVGSGPDKTSYGFSIRTDTSGADQTYISISAGHTATFEGLTVRHVAITCSGPGDNVGQVGIATGTQADNRAMIVQSVYVDNCQNAILLIGSKWLIEGSYFGRAWSSAQHHGEQIDVFGVPSVTFRNNVIAHCRGTTCIGNGNVDDWDIYGNVFADIQTGNGVIGAAGGDQISNSRIYDNTIIDNQSTSFLYQNNPNAGSGQGNVVKNNLFFRSNALFAENGGGAIDHGYNAFFDSPTSAPGASDDVGTGDPFVGSATGDYHLVNATKPGLTLPATYAVDPEGHARGQDGNWDRGAFEYCTGGCAPSGGDGGNGPADAGDGGGVGPAGDGGASGSVGDGGVAGATADGGGAGGPGGAADPGAATRSGAADGGCACREAPRRVDLGSVILVLAAATLGRLRRRRRP